MQIPSGHPVHDRELTMKKTTWNTRAVFYYYLIIQFPSARTYFDQPALMSCVICLVLRINSEEIDRENKKK